MYSEMLELIKKKGKHEMYERLANPKIKMKSEMKMKKEHRHRPRKESFRGI